MKRVVIAAVTALTVAAASSAGAQSFFRIVSGSAGGNYFPMAGILANAISNPPGSRPCDKGGPCGVPGLIAIAQSANGSVANINAIRSGTLESGFAQSDVTFWAHTGTGIYADRGKVEKLRAITSLYPESIHLVARPGAEIDSVADLAGKRVSLDEPGSGTLVDARLILEAFGLGEDDLEADYIKPTPAGDKLRDGQLDAFFIVAGYPTGSVAELCASAGCELVPIAGPEVDALIEDYGFFASDTIPAGTYEGVDEGIPTVSVAALWVTSTDVDEELVYQVTRALWNDNSRALLDKGHAKGQQITLDTALDGIGIPLHAGAQRYYKEAGQL
ncbi:MAG: TAXI family TRAP transporter solute-binding subunit [Candidatus Competibacterales bacterium]|nr:TAXI family TRAP transporter solute-binding subunit [Candidatus Competibacterales bacterium]